jgi:hypothetical protein
MQISENLLQNIANYLVTKPYMEVVGLLSELQKEVQVAPKVEETKEEVKEDK